MDLMKFRKGNQLPEGFLVCANILFFQAGASVSQIGLVRLTGMHDHLQFLISVHHQLSSLAVPNKCLSFLSRRNNIMKGRRGQIYWIGQV